LTATGERHLLSNVAGKNDPKALVASVLGNLGAKPNRHPDAGSFPQPPPSPAADNAHAPPADAEETARAAPAAPADVEAELHALINLYFELEEPAERDALFDQLVSYRSPMVTEFLQVMMQEDEDEFVRAAAAAELARRGVKEGLDALQNDLEDPEKAFFFVHAVQVLSEVLGAPFYDALKILWQDPNGDADQRREAMLGLENLDNERALADFIDFINSTENIDDMPDDQVEVAMMAFVRHEHTAAHGPLEALRDRIRKAVVDADERQELVSFVQEGIDLLVGE